MKIITLGLEVPVQEEKLDISRLYLEMYNYIKEAEAKIKALEGVKQPGDWKRKQVYAHLMNAFPIAKHMDLSLSVELALRKVRKLTWH